MASLSVVRVRLSVVRFRLSVVRVLGLVLGLV